MAFAPALLDDFNRANQSGLGTSSPVAGTWTGAIFPPSDPAGTPDIIGNAAGCGAAHRDAYHSVPLGPDVQVAFDIGTKSPDGSYMSIYCRIQSPGVSGAGDGYEVELDCLAGTDNITCYRVDNASFVQLTPSSGTEAQELSTGDAVGIEVLGTGATVTINTYYKIGAGAWTLRATYLDSTANRVVAAGPIGIQMGDTTGRINAVYATDLSVAPTSLEPLAFRH